MSDTTDIAQSLGVDDEYAEELAGRLQANQLPDNIIRRISPANEGQQAAVILLLSRLRDALSTLDAQAEQAGLGASTRRSARSLFFRMVGEAGEGPALLTALLDDPTVLRDVAQTAIGQAQKERDALEDATDAKMGGSSAP